MKVPPVLAIRDLSLEFPTYRGAVHALSGIDVEVAPGEIVALVGESGSGKSVAAMASIRLLPPKLFKITGGSIALLGRDVLAEPARSIGNLRGKLVSMVFQEPMSALNPTIRIGRQITQVLRRHEAMEPADARRASAAAALGDAGLGSGPGHAQLRLRAQRRHAPSACSSPWPLPAIRSC